MIFKKTFNSFNTFIVFSLLIVSFTFFSCSSGLNKPKYVSVNFTMDKAAVRQIVEQTKPLRQSYRAAGLQEVQDDQNDADDKGKLDNLFIEVTLFAEESQTATEPLTEKVQITFENILVGTKIYAKAQVFEYLDEAKTQKNVIYRGQSNSLIVRDTANVLKLTLKNATVQITFESNGGSAVKPQTILSGQAAEEPENPVKPEGKEKYSRENYAFAGWFTDEELTKQYNFENPVRYDITLYAKWIPDFVLVQGETVQNSLKEGRSLRISDLFVSDHEVSQAEYAAVAGKNPSNNKSSAAAELPVENVSWFDAIVYCNKLSIKEGLNPCYKVSGETDPSKWGEITNETVVSCSLTENGYRLPTESEWEYIAQKAKRTNTAFSKLAYYSENGENKTHKIKYKLADELCLCDLLGNVAEWCFDWYESEIGRTGATGPITGTTRVIRGGSYQTSGDQDSIMAQRDYAAPISNDPSVGFRVVRTVVNEYKIIKNTVTFEPNGGSSVEVQIVVNGNEATEPAVPTRTGYEFKGWNYGGEPFDFSTPITMDILLEAKWQVIEYTITYDPDGGTIETADPDKYTIETETFTLHNPTKNLWNFKGWFDGSNKITKIEKGSYGNLNLVAHWTQCHIVTFNTNGGGTIEEQEVENNSYATVPDPAPEKTGYDLKRWYTTDQNTAFDFEGTPITGNITINALWTPHEYTIDYDLDEGTNDPSNIFNYTIETATFTLADASRDGYDFDGWFDSSNNQVTQITLGSTGNVSLTAHWTPHNYTITYDLNAADSPGANSNVANDPDNPVTYTITTPTITLKPATRTGYTFNGWKNSATGSTITEIPLGSFEDFTLIAQWLEEDENLGTITITLGEPVGDISVSQETESGTITYIADSGYDSYSWIFDGDETTKQSGETVTTYQVNTTNLKSGVYDVYLEAEKDGVTYTWTQQFTK